MARLSRRGREAIDIGKQMTLGVDFILRPAPRPRKRLNFRRAATNTSNRRFVGAHPAAVVPPNHADGRSMRNQLRPIRLFPCRQPLFFGDRTDAESAQVSHELIEFRRANAVLEELDVTARKPGLDDISANSRAARASIRELRELKHLTYVNHYGTKITYAGFTRARNSEHLCRLGTSLDECCLSQDVLGGPVFVSVPMLPRESGVDAKRQSRIRSQSHSGKLKPYSGVIRPGFQRIIAVRFVRLRTLPTESGDDRVSETRRFRDCPI
jgi:hypothetical protein